MELFQASIDTPSFACLWVTASKLLSKLFQARRISCPLSLCLLVQWMPPSELRGQFKPAGSALPLVSIVWAVQLLNYWADSNSLGHCCWAVMWSSPFDWCCGGNANLSAGAKWTWFSTEGNKTRWGKKKKKKEKKKDYWTPEGLWLNLAKTRVLKCPVNNSTGTASITSNI